MKQLLFLLIIFLASCKKEVPTQQPDTAQSGRLVSTTVTPPELSTVMFINGSVFIPGDVGINRDYIVSIENSSTGATIGTVSFNMAKGTVFENTFNPISHISNVLTGVQNQNSDWTITDLGDRYLLSTKAGVIIAGNSNSIVGFQVKRKPFVPVGTTENIWVSVPLGSGGDVNPANNNANLHFVCN